MNARAERLLWGAKMYPSELDLLAVLFICTEGCKLRFVRCSWVLHQVLCVHGHSKDLLERSIGVLFVDFWHDRLNAPKYSNKLGAPVLQAGDKVHRDG